MKKTLATLAATAVLTVATPAMAEPITLGSDDIGNSFSIDLDGFSGDNTNTIDGLTATLLFTLESISNGMYTFSYGVQNTTSDPLTSNISSFSFNVDPDISGANSTGAYPFSFVADGRGSDPRLPNQIGNVDVCFKARSSGSCSNGGGVSQGETGTGSLSLLFDGGTPDSITLSDFFVRYQGITGAGGITSATGQQTSSTSTSGVIPPGGTTTTTSTSGTPVPAPGMLGLLALALASLGLIRRRGGQRSIRQPYFA